MTQGATPFWHQVRDQALHVALGSFAGLITESLWQGAAIAGFYGAVREGEQWGTLNTPSVKDSAIDWTFVVLGGLLGAFIRAFIGA